MLIELTRSLLLTTASALRPRCSEIPNDLVDHDWLRVAHDCVAVLAADLLFQRSILIDLEELLLVRLCL